MTYVPIRTVVISGGKLVESTDLTKPVSFFVGKQAYLVLDKDRVIWTISINKPILFETGLDLTLPISSAFTSKLSDLFVAKYVVNHIPIKNEANTYDKRLRVFNPISYKNYNVSYTSQNNPSVVDDPTMLGFLDDLVISAPDDDFTNALVAVNGIFHRTALLNKKLYVLDGFRTMRITDHKDVTIVDTKALGGHTTIPLTPNNVTLSTYNGVAYIKSPTSLRGKTVFLVIDGYFVHLDLNAFYFADDKTIKVLTNKLSLVSQFRHNPKTMHKVDRFGQDASQTSRKYNDPYEILYLNSRQVPASTFRTKEFQLSRLTAYHSFLVVIDNPSVFQLNFDIMPTGVPQYYTDPINRVISGMMSYGVGLCPSYLILKDPWERKSIFTQGQDLDLDRQKDSYNPVFIPSIISDPTPGANISSRFVDYVSA